MARRKTHEAFENEIKIINPRIKLLSKYTTAKEKVQCECIDCGNVWNVRASHLLEGTGCPKCSRLKTNNDFLMELSNCNANIVALEKYSGALVPINFKCKIDNHIWKSRPSSILYGEGCPICASKNRAISLKKDPLYFLEEMKQLNPNIEILDNYVNNKTKLLCRCKIDNNEWYGTPSSLLKGQGCPICGAKKVGEALRKSNNVFLSEFNKLNTNIKLLSNYQDANTKINCRCEICRYEWWVYPNSLLQGHGCPNCVGLIKTHQIFVKEMQDKNPNIIILGEYQNVKTKVLCKCKIDGNEWYTTPNRLLNGSGCPQCNESRGERIISNMLNNDNIPFERQKSFDNLKGIGHGKLSYDFYIPVFGVLIEYNGIQHYEPIEYFGGQKQLNIQLEHDKRKREYAKQNNIKLIEIPYWEFDNIEKILSKELRLTS